MKHISFTLDNGIRAILVPIQEVASVTAMVMVGAGSRYETKKNNGVSHFLEHMAFKGTEKRPTALEIATSIDGKGAESNAFTGKEATAYYIKSAATHLDFSLDVLSDVLLHSKFDKEEIDRERHVIIEEINMYEDLPMRKIGDDFEALLYGDTPLGWDIAGVKDIILNMQRDDFVSYMSSLYSADNMIVVVSGRMDVEKTKDKITEYFSGFRKFETRKWDKVTESQDKSQVFLRSKKTEQAHFALGFRTLGLLDSENAKDRYPLSILSAILGGGMSSRLFYEVRERRGLAYYVRAYDEQYFDAGYLASFAGVQPTKIDEAIKVVVDEYHKLENNSEITQKELVKAKEYTKGHFVMDLEDTKSIAVYYGMKELLERKEANPDDILKKIDMVTLDEVNAMIKKYFKMQTLNLALIGDFEDKSRFENLLK